MTHTKTATITHNRFSKFKVQRPNSKNFTQGLRLINLDTKKEVIALNFYDTPSIATACLWINHSVKDTHISVYDKSKGIGYHRHSDAFANCLFLADIKLNFNIAGRGNEAIKDALTAIAEALGINDSLIVDVQG